MKLNLDYRASSLNDWWNGRGKAGPFNAGVRAEINSRYIALVQALATNLDHGCRYLLPEF